MILLLDDRGKRDDIEKEDEMEEYLRYMEENPMAGVVVDEEDDVQYDSDGNHVAGERSKVHIHLCLFVLIGIQLYVMLILRMFWM